MPLCQRGCWYQLGWTDSQQPLVRNGSRLIASSMTAKQLNDDFIDDLLEIGCQTGSTDQTSWQTRSDQRQCQFGRSEGFRSRNDGQGNLGKIDSPPVKCLTSDRQHLDRPYNGKIETFHHWTLFAPWQGRWDVHLHLFESRWRIDSLSSRGWHRYRWCRFESFNLFDYDWRILQCTANGSCTLEKCAEQSTRVSQSTTILWT